MAEDAYRVRYVNADGSYSDVEKWDRERLFAARRRAEAFDFSDIPSGVRRVEYQLPGSPGWQGFGPGPLSEGAR
jgi:hypothetical protein